MKRLLAVPAWSAVLGSAFLSAPAHAQINVKIGVLTDMSSLYAYLGGPGSVAAAKMAIAYCTAEHQDIRSNSSSATT